MTIKEPIPTNPWASIWTRPRSTLRALILKNPRQFVHELAILGGILGLTAWSVGNKTPLQFHSVSQNIFFIALLLILGALAGLFNLYIGSWLYLAVGRWLGGKGTFTEIKAAIGWSQYPYAVCSFLLILSAWALPLPALYVTLTLIFLVLSIWSYVLFCFLLGEAHHFSAWRAFASSLILALLFICILFLVALFVYTLTSLKG